MPAGGRASENSEKAAGNGAAGSRSTVVRTRRTVPLLRIGKKRSGFITQLSDFCPGMIAQLGEEAINARVVITNGGVPDLSQN